MDKYLEKIKELKVEIKNLEEELCYIENEIAMNENKHKELNKAKDNELGKMQDSISIKKEFEFKTKNLKKLKHKFIANFFFNQFSGYAYCLPLVFIALVIICPIPLILFLNMVPTCLIWTLSFQRTEEYIGYFETKRNLKNINMEDIENDIEKQKEKVNSIQYLTNIVKKKLEELNLNKETIKREINNKLFEITNIEKLREKAINEYLVNNPEVNDLFNQEYTKLENQETIESEKQFVKCRKSTNNIN